MKKNITSILLLLVTSLSYTVFAQTVYVATDGNDTNDGTINNPYKTFAKANSVISAGGVCIIREGVYTEPLVITKNGTDGNPITFKAADGETVEIRATLPVSGWELHSGNIYKASVNMSIAQRFRVVYHNDEYMDLARWPNNADNNRWTVDCTPVTGGDGSHFTVDNIPNIDWTGGFVYYIGAHSGTSWTRLITDNTTNRIEHQGVDINKWPFTPHNPTVWRNYPNNNRGQLFLFNKLEALDHDREWYYDTSTNTLYFQPPGGTMPSDGDVQYAAMEYTAELKSDYIVLDGISFFGGSVKIHNNADNNQILNCKIIHGVECLDELDNTDAQVGESALQVLGENTLVKGCVIDHSSANGISIANWAGAHNCVVEENYISNIDYLGIHSKPISTGARNIKVLRNTITNAGRDGITVGGLNSEIAYNDISHSNLINSDSGIYYVVGNTELKNVEVHHNWFHDATAPSYSHGTNEPAKAAGIYLDNDSKGYTVHHNVIWNVSWSGYQVNWNNTNLDFYHNTIWNAERAMDSWVNGRDQENNKVYNNYANTGSWFTGNGTSEFDIQNSPIFPDSPFVDADNLNFMPKVGSALIDQGMTISGFDKPFQGGAPDIGAYERGGTAWTAGVNAIEDTGVGQTLSINDIRFSIQTFSETCPGANNGSLAISAEFTGDYMVTFNNSDINFTDETTIENINIGTYDLCISFVGETENQCSTVVIGELSEIFGKFAVANSKLNVIVDAGTAPYTVYVNDKVSFETFATSFSVDVNHGDEVKIKSSRDCEGDMLKTIDFYSNAIAYPNPTQDDFQLIMPIDKGEVQVELYDLRAQLISSKRYSINSGKIDLSLGSRPSGIYFAKIVNAKQPVMVKVVKY